MTNNLKLYFCCITQDRLNEFKNVYNNIYPYVDKLIIIDGGSTDGTQEWVIENDKDNKVHLVVSPWEDLNSFPQQRQKYLDAVRELREDNESSWILIQDSDEMFSKDLLEKVRIMCQRGDNVGTYRYLVRCKSVELDSNYKPVKEQYDDYWKPLIYKWFPELRITGNRVHEGFNLNPKTEYFTKYKDEVSRKQEKTYWYSHSKPPGEVWYRAHFRNFVQGGGGDNMGEFNPLWLPFLSLIKDIISDYKSWWDYGKYVQNSKGEIDQRLIEWYVAHMYEGVKEKPEEWKSYVIDNKIIGKYGLNKNFLSDLELKVGFDFSGQSEIREGYKYFFRFLYPNKEPQELKNLSIP